MKKPVLYISLLWLCLGCAAQAKAGASDTDSSAGERSEYFLKSEQARLVARELQETRRDLLQSKDRSERLTRRKCDLQSSLIDAHYNASAKTWRVDEQLLDEVNSDLQRVVDCVRRTDTILLTQNLKLDPRRTLEVRRSMRFVGDASSVGQLPVWTCGKKAINDRIVFIKGAADVVFKDIHFSECNSNRTLTGPMHVVKSSVSVVDCRFTNNYSQYGGGIWASNSTLELRNCIFEGNYASRNGGALAAAAGSSVTIRNSRFLRNECAALGGAVALFNETTASLREVTFVENIARLQGGAVFGLNKREATDVQFDKCQFTGNQVRGLGTGGVNLFGYRTVISNSTFSRNSGALVGAVSLDRVQNETALPLMPEVSATISDCSFVRNSGTSGMGALRIRFDGSCVIERSRFLGNSAFLAGGAVLLDGKMKARLSEVELLNNSVSTGSGGALQFTGADLPESGSELGLSTALNVSMSKVTCRENSAFSSGGCLHMEFLVAVSVVGSSITGNVASEGGGISGFRSQALTMREVTLNRNEASGRGGGLLVQASAVEDVETRFPQLIHTTLNIELCSFKNCKAANGGAIYIEGDFAATLQNTAFSDNSAHLVGGAVYLRAAQYGRNDTATAAFYTSTNRSNTRQVLERARFQTDGPENLDLRGIMPTGVVVAHNVTFVSNRAGHNGGALASRTGILVWAQNSSFLENSAGDLGGAAHIQQSLFYCHHCNFHKNSAKTSGGACVIHGITDGETRGTAVCEGGFKSSAFSGNKAGDYGGAVLAEGFDTHLYASGNAVFRHNEARAGGAIASNFAARLNLTSISFVENRATTGGGAISVSYMKRRDAACLITDVEFRKNSAPAGGAVFAEYFVFVDDQIEDPTDLGLTPSSARFRLMFISETLFADNSASDGGAILLKGVSTSIKNVIATRNAALETGGACSVRDGSSVNLVNGRFFDNHAGSGGAIMINDRSAVHCTDCQIRRNRAHHDGGGVALSSVFAPIQPSAFHCTACTIRENNANLGGGIYFHYDASTVNKQPSDLAVVVLRKTLVRGNHAKIGGGGIIVSHPELVGIACIRSGHPKHSKHASSVDFVTEDEISQMARLTDIDCLSWTGNTVGSDGYGPLKATFATVAVACADSNDTCEGSNKRLPTHSSAHVVPAIRITLLDKFGQRPAEPRPEDRTASTTISSDRVRLSGQMNSQFERGRALFNETSVIGSPGPYRVTLHLSDASIKSLELNTELRSCQIGEQKVLNNTACQRCEIGTYSIEESADTCHECPENGLCDSWGIVPKDGYWIPSPCFTHPKRCLFEAGCTRDDRQKELEDYLGRTKQTCDLERPEIDEFQNKQCSEGYGGPLCGSCSEGFGLVDLECHNCASKFVVVALLLVNVAWILFLCWIAIKGNLDDISSIDSPAKRLQGVATTSEGNTFEMSAVAGPQPGPSSQPEASTSDDGGAQQHEFELAKKNVSERLKVFINFAQVNSMALWINSNWSRPAAGVLKMLDFFSSIPAGSAFAYDCLFSESSWLPRSMKSTILSLLFPILVLLLFDAYWGWKLRERRRVLKRRLVMTAVVVFYVSYLSIARRAITVLHCVGVYDGAKVEDASRDLLWAQDTSVKCYEGVHVYVFGLLALPLIITVLIGFPIVSACLLFSLREHDSLSYVEVRETFGFMFQAYKADFVYWDCTILLRKAILVLISIFGSPLGGNMQGLIAVSVLAVALYLQTNCSPFNDDFESLNSSEKASLAVSFVTFLSGVYLNDSSITQGGRLFFSGVIISLNLAFVLSSIHDICVRALDVFHLELLNNNIPIEPDDSSFKLVVAWLKHKAENFTARFKAADAS